MSTDIQTNQVLAELKAIRKELVEIKENMPDKEMFLTAEEEKRLEESYVNEKNGKLVNSADLRKALGI